MIKVVGQALGEYGDQLVAEIEKEIAEEVKKLRAEMNLKRASDDGDVVPLCTAATRTPRVRRRNQLAMWAARIFQSNSRCRSPKLRQSRIDPRKHRCLSELRSDPLCFGQMMYGEGWLFLSLVEQPEDQVRAAHLNSLGIVMRVL